MKQWIKKLLAKIADKYPKLQENILQDIRLQKSRFLLASVYCLHMFLWTWRCTSYIQWH